MSPLMEPRRRLIAIWAVVALLVGVVAVPLSGPLLRAWSCYRLHDSGARDDAVLVEKLENMFVMRLATGAHTGKVCTAKTSAAEYDDAVSGQVFEVVYRADRGECVLDATIVRSGIVLWSISGGAASLLLLIASIGAWAHQSLTTPAFPRRRMNVEGTALACPVCGGEMAEGYLPMLAGVHWRGLGQPVGTPHNLSGLPGTVGWRRRPLLHAFRCPECQIVSFQYGAPPPTSS
jgi:hypothetical protein